MIKKVIFITLVTILISCKTSKNLKIYKDKDILTLPVFTNSISDFPWKYKSLGFIDSLDIKSKKIYSIINSLEKIPNNQKRIGIPRYALVLEYYNKKDTLYFYDFNGENYKNEAYMVQNNITLKDSNNELKKYLFKHYYDFIIKEYDY
jgi:hypothetical protein